MHEGYFEQIHSAAADCPYIDFERRNLSYVPHYHNEIELVYVKTGTVTVFCASGTVTAAAGDIAVLMPGEIHSFSTECSNLVYVIKINAKNSAFGYDLSKYRIIGALIKSGTSQNAVIAELIEKMTDERKEERFGSPFAVNAYAELIITQLLRCGLLQKQDSDARRKNEATLTLLAAVTDFVESHLLENIPLERIAAQCNMSKYYFAHTFKDAAGVTFFEYLTSCRIDIAKRLLSETKHSITEISHQSGFSNTRVFNRLFRARVGMPPSEYRKYSAAPSE